MAIRIHQTKNKYGNVRTRCRKNHNHPSKGEATECDRIHLILKSRDTEWDRIEYEKTYELRVKGQLICRHKPDWTIYKTDGSQIVWEYKGKETATWRLKKKLFMVIFPDIEYHIIKKRKRKL